MNKEMYIPCLIDPRRKCAETCKMNDLAKLVQYARNSERRHAMTQEEVFDVFENKNLNNIASLITEKINQYEMTEQLYKCKEFSDFIKGDIS
jgi:hypothetical protein